MVRQSDALCPSLDCHHCAFSSDILGQRVEIHDLEPMSELLESLAAAVTRIILLSFPDAATRPSASSY